MKCEVCNKEFQPKAFWQKFCSKTCRHLGWALREVKKVRGEDVKEKKKV